MENYLKTLFTGQSFDEKNFFLIAGPCVVETEEIVMEVADKVSAVCKNLGIPYIFKASYRKANRTSAGSFTGIGNENSCSIILIPYTINSPITLERKIKAHWTRIFYGF